MTGFRRHKRCSGHLHHAVRDPLRTCAACPDPVGRCVVSGTASCAPRAALPTTHPLTRKARMARYDNILQTIGNTPIVRLNKLAPPGVHLHVKVESFNPLGSVK